MSFSYSTPNLPLRQRAQIPPPQLSLVDDPIFIALYAGNGTNLRNFLKGGSPLNSSNDLSNVYSYIENRGEPGPTIQYENIPYALTAMRSFLQGSPHGKRLLDYFGYLLKVRGGHMITSAEVLAFEVHYKMHRTLFASQNDQRLREHIINLIPGAQRFMKVYPAEYHQIFEDHATNAREQLYEANNAASTELYEMKVSNEFKKMYGQLINAHKVHESKLAAVRQRAAKDKAEREAMVSGVRARNDAGIVRQMGMAGLTAHTQQVENAVVEYVQDVSSECFPRVDENEELEANSEIEPMYEMYGMAA